MYATGSRCAALTASPGGPLQLHHQHHTVSHQPFSYRRVVSGGHETSPPSLGNDVLGNGINNQVLSGYHLESSGRVERTHRQQQQQQQQSSNEHQTLADFLPVSSSPSSGSCRQLQQPVSFFLIIEIIHGNLYNSIPLAC